MIRTGYVYALRVDDPRGRFWVVGSTAKTPAERLADYWRPDKTHGHTANAVRRAGPGRVFVVAIRKVVYSDSSQLEVAEGELARWWQSRGLPVRSDQL